MCQDLSDVVAAGAEHEEHGTADGAVQGASRQAAIGLHVANLCLDGASTSQVCDQFWRQAAPCATDPDAGRLNTVAAVSAIDDGQIGALDQA